VECGGAISRAGVAIFYALGLGVVACLFVQGLGAIS